MRTLSIHRLASASLALGLSAATGAVCAQDSFDGKPPARGAPAAAPTLQQPLQPPPPSPSRAANDDRTAVQTAAPGSELRDFGVKPTTQLRPTDALHAPTPTSIPGGRVVRTQQLAQWLQGAPGQVLLLHAIGNPLHLPQAVAAVPASQGGSYDDAVQRDFGNYLQQATGGDRSRRIVTYCAGVQCWGSYNAALRAIRMGYTNVHWYRGGMEAWEQAGLPLMDASAQGTGRR